MPDTISMRPIAIDEIAKSRQLATGSFILASLLSGNAAEPRLGGGDGGLALIERRREIDHARLHLFLVVDVGAAGVGEMILVICALAEQPDRHELQAHQ